MTTRILSRFATATAALLLALTANAQEFTLKLQSEGAMGKLFSYYVPTPIQLSAESPAAIKKVPADLRAPLFGVLTLGPAEEPTSVYLVVDEPDTGEVRLFLDSNANGDLTDDPPAKWALREDKRRDGSPGVAYRGSGMLNVRFGADSARLNYQFYRFDKNDPARKTQVRNFFYYRDHARTGEITLGGKSYRVALSNDSNLADYRTSSKRRAQTLQIDVNGDGRYDYATERYETGKPFNIGGKNYLATVLDAAGSKLRIEPSAIAAVERKTQNRGDALQSFTAKTTDGKEVNVPGDFKGKLVMLDFWATWCGPCIGELPNLISAYEKYHAQGFEVVGISLDSKPVAEVQQFADGKGMKWPQIVEGDGWKTRLAVLFNVQSIPKAILVDGNTGKIVADEGLRGSTLAPAIEKALGALEAAKGSDLQAPRLIGLVHLNGDSRALFQASRKGRSATEYFTLRTHEQIHDFEVIEIDRMKEVVYARYKTQNLEFPFAGASDSLAPQIKDRTESCFIRLENCPVQLVVILYTEMIGRSALQHPALKRESFTLRQITPNKGEAARGLETAMAQNGISAILDGEKFVLIVPTVIAKTVSTHSFNIAPKPKPPKLGQQWLLERGGFRLYAMPATQFAELYAAVVGKKLKSVVGRRAGSLTFESQTDLTQAEIIHAMDTLFAWNNVKIVLLANDTIQAVPLDETTKP